MTKLVLQQCGLWIGFRSSNTTFIACVKTGISPSSYRKYDSENRCWLVFWEKAPDLAAIASKFYSVDWGDLPGAWQMLIAGAKSHQHQHQHQHQHPVVLSPFSELYLLDNAPLCVVKASYKALLLENHPDHNDGKGDNKKLNEVIQAYRKIISIFDT